jgi:RND family efflux transporter MFP subunit
MPINQATVKAKVSGEVRQMLVREGDPVRAGQRLGMIDTADLESKLIERQGALESARAQMALAEKTRASNQKLLNEKFISQTAFDSSQSGYDVAKGNVKSIEAQVKIAENALRDAEIVAPIAGRRRQAPRAAGEKVAFDAPLVTVVDLSDLELQALVPAIDVPGLAVGMSVELAVDGFGERKFAGRIVRINPSTEPGTRAILVYVALRNPDAALRSGMFANGRVALAASEPIASLPQAAVRTEAGQSFIWVIVDGKLARRIVTLGRRDDVAGLVEVPLAAAEERCRCSRRAWRT